MTIDKLILLFVSLSSSYLEQQNERYLHLAAKLLDAKEQAATFKLEKNKQGQKEAQEKIRKFQRGKYFKILYVFFIGFPRMEVASSLYVFSFLTVYTWGWQTFATSQIVNI